MEPNELYKLIQQKQADIDTQTATLADKQVNAPQAEANLRETVMGGDTLLDDLRNQYSEGVLNLFKYDQEKSKSYLSPELQAKGMVADPMVGDAARNAKFNATAKTNEEVWRQLDKRKTILGDTIKSAMDLYNAELEGDKTRIDAAQKSLDTALDMYKYDRTETRLSSIETDSTAKERLKKETLANVKNLAEKGYTIDDLFMNFGDSQYVNKDEVLKVYNETNYYKKAPVESEGELTRKWKAAQSGFESTDLLAALTTDERKTIQPKATVVGQLNAVTEKMRELAGGDPNFASNFKAGQFGLYKDVNKIFSNDQQLKQIIARISAAERKDIFGATLTANEQADADKWLAGSKKELSNQLWSKLLAAIDFNKSQVNSIFQDRGISQQEIDNYWAKKMKLTLDSTGTSTTSSGTGSDNSQLSDDEIKKLLGQ